MTIPASLQGKLAGLLVKNLTDERALGYVMNVPIFSAPASPPLSRRAPSASA